MPLSLGNLASSLPPVVSPSVITGTAANAAKKVAAKSGDKMPFTIALIVIVLLFMFVIIYILFMIKSPRLSGKQLISDPVRLNQMDTPTEIASSLLPPSSVGREYSFSFWIYLDSYDQTYTASDGKMLMPIDKMVFYRGVSGSVMGANPVVFMDGLSNKLYIAIKTQNSSPDNKPELGVDYNANLYNFRSMNYFTNPKLKLRDQSALQGAINKYMLVGVDYVPLQRWVHIAFVVDNKLLTVFVDGEIYSVKSTDEYKTMRESELDIRGRPIDVNVIADKTDGNVYVGKNGAVGSGTAAPGYLSRLQYFNYALPLTDVKRQYGQGPTKTGLFGINGVWSYGIRSPLYKLDDQST